MAATAASEPGGPIAGRHDPRLFRSFWIGGFEGADHLNANRVALSMNEANQHWQRLEEDYSLLEQFGIRTVRETIGWRITEALGSEGFDRLQARAEIAQRHGIQVVWTLMHYGWPDDVDLLSPAFVDRFGAFSEQVARVLCRVRGGAGAHLATDASAAPNIYQPVNEISFLTWALSATGLMNHPVNTGLAGIPEPIKRQLVSAAIRACDVVRAIDPGARFMHCDPLMHIVVPPGSPPELEQQAWRAQEDCFEAFDMLQGQVAPELGGSPQYLDILGFNYYHNNQSEFGSNASLYWHLGNPRRKPLHQLLAHVWQRYSRPMMIAETSHVGDGRGQWLDYMGREIDTCLAGGMPIEGVCLYPILDRPSWDDSEHWHNSGLWDVDTRRTGGKPASFDRITCLPYARRLRHWQQRIPAGPPDTGQASRMPDAAGCSADTGAQAGARTLYPLLNNPGESVVPTIIVFSHLRWSFVYQRPQHLLSRLASHYRIVFMEEPVPGAEHDHLEQLSPADNIEVLRPHLTGHLGGFHDDLLPKLQSQLANYLRESGIDDYLVWFYTPMALPLANDLHPTAIIYDCMDELSAFRNAPRQLVQRENALYQQADLVLTGGPSLYRSKLERHHNVHCFSSSVDAAHFAPKGEGQADHPAQAGLPKPRLGYCGVIDERVDIGLIAAMADAHPEWQIVMVGPVAKIPHESLPQRANIHWLGQQGYNDLPQFMAGWDVCLLPFALNESTQFISPTKTLEYMAAGKPSVSTRIRDVAEPYGHVVAIADSELAFIEACESMLAQTAEQQAASEAEMQAILAGTSWDRTAGAILALIEGLPHAAQEEAANSGFGPERFGEIAAPLVVRADHAWKTGGKKVAQSAQGQDLAAGAMHSSQQQRTAKAYKPAA